MKKTATFLALAVAAIFSAQAIEQTYYDWVGDDPNNYGTLGVEATDDLSKVLVWVGCDNQGPIQAITCGLEAPEGYKWSTISSKKYARLSTIGTKENGGEPRVTSEFWAVTTKQPRTDYLTLGLTCGDMYVIGPEGCCDSENIVSFTTHGPLMDANLDMTGAEDGDYTVKLLGSASEPDYVSLTLYWTPGDELTPDGVVKGTPTSAVPTASTFQGIRQYDLPSVTFTIEGGKVTKAARTGVEDIKTNNVKAAVKGIYNLQGQRVRETVPGQLYIIDGKKVIANSVITD